MKKVSFKVMVLNLGYILNHPTNLKKKNNKMLKSHMQII